MSRVKHNHIFIVINGLLSAPLTFKAVIHRKASLIITSCISDHNRLWFQAKNVETNPAQKSTLERENTEMENAPKVANQRFFYNHQKVQIDAKSAKCIWLEMTWSPLYYININYNRRYHTYCTESQGNERS